MKKIEVELEGISPLLIHSAQAMEEQTAVKNPTKNYDPQEECEKVVYRNPTTKALFVPARCLKASILNASAWYKFGKKSAKQIIAGSITLSPYEITITDKKGKPVTEYIVDRRPVVVQRSRIIRSRPRVDEWILKFEIVYNERMIGDVNIINNIIEEAGLRIGLLDNRPQRYGDCGMFRIKKFLPKDK